MILHSYEELDTYLGEKVLLVCDSSIQFLKINDYFDRKENIVRFSEFVPNPLYESVVKGVELFHKEGCDTIVAVGGGSAMDVAKCIKLYSNMNSDENYLKQKIVPNDVPLIAVPTTAGTGSEATRYAVIYYEGEKQSIADYSCIPSIVLFDTSVLETLPLYQKKATLMDAMCHSIESFWSVNSNDESKQYSKEALSLIVNNYKDYLAGDNSKNELMLRASHIAGKAINITQTTAGHAMSYKLTSLFKIAHGHAAALCIKGIWPFMVKHIESCIDARGEGYLKNTFGEIAETMGCSCVEEAIEKFANMVDELELSVPEGVSDKDYEVLRNSVNPVRLKNNPVALSVEDIDIIYHDILGERQK
ncbi:MAG: phosphonoacetaldehyde reductase [Erysipelotrichaceae bacterium]